MLPTPLQSIADKQAGLITRRQALDAGLSERQVRSALHRTWTSVLPGVFHTGRAPLTSEQRLVAALLYAGDDAAVTGASAARWYGLRQPYDGEMVRLVVPRHRSKRTVRWVSIARTEVPFDLYVDGPRRFVSPERAVVEAARSAASPEQAEAIVIEAVQKRVASLADLTAMNDRLGRRGSALAERGIRAAGSGAWSVPESGLYRLASTSRVLPEMWCNPDLFAEDGRRLLTPDGWYDDVGLAVMVHSRQFHDGPRWASTVERDGDLVAQGVRVLALAPTSIAREPARVLARIEDAHRAARAAGGRASVRAHRWNPW